MSYVLGTFSVYNSQIRGFQSISLFLFLKPSLFSFSDALTICEGEVGHSHQNLHLCKDRSHLRLSASPTTNHRLKKHHSVNFCQRTRKLYAIQSRVHSSFRSLLLPFYVIPRTTRSVDSRTRSSSKCHI